MTIIVLAGGTGLIGRQAIDRIVALDDTELHLITRRPVEGISSLVKQHVADPAKWPSLITSTRPDVAISCLGTTIKTAGSKAAFAAVDFDLVVAFAKAARVAGSSQMIAVSSVGASARASNFYLSTKGKTENSLRLLGFDRLDLLRPGLLRGDRHESRKGEALGIKISPITDLLLQGSLRRYRSIDSGTVAGAIAKLAKTNAKGVFVHQNDALTTLAG